MNDTDESLRDLKKEVIEARALIIKSNNLVNSLAAEVRSIARRQTGYERRISWNSVAAYAFFVVLAYLGMRLAFEHQSAQYSRELVQARKASDQIKRELSDLKNKSKSQHRDEKELLALHQLIRDGRREEALDVYEKLDKGVLTETEKVLFEDHMEGIKSVLSIKKYQQGIDLLNKKKYTESVEAFKASIALKKDAGHTPSAQIEMANALRLQGKPREAIAILQQLIEEHLDRELADDAYWYLALCFAEAHQKDEARAVLKNLMRQFPDSQYLRLARVKIQELTVTLYKEEE